MTILSAAIATHLVKDMTDKTLSRDERAQAGASYVARLGAECKLELDDPAATVNLVGENTRALLGFVAEHPGKDADDYRAQQDIMEVSVQALGLLRKYLISLYIDERMAQHKVDPEQPAPQSYYPVCYALGQEVIAPALEILTRIEKEEGTSPGTKVSAAWCKQTLAGEEKCLMRNLSCENWTDPPFTALKDGPPKVPAAPPENAPAMK